MRKSLKPLPVLLGLVLFSFLFIPLLRADLLYMKDGRILLVEILSEDENYVTFEQDGLKLKYAKDAVNKILYDEEPPAPEGRKSSSFAPALTAGVPLPKEKVVFVEPEPLGRYLPVSTGPGGLEIVTELEADLTTEAIQPEGKSEKKAYRNKNPEEGPYQFYHNNGNVKAELLFEKGLPQGPFTLYYWNGIVKEKGAFKDGELEGKYRTYYPKGQLKEKGSFLSGKTTGEYKIYYENKRLKEKGSSKNGKAEGAYTAYYDNGRVKEEGFFREGRPEGEVLRYSEEKILISEWTIKYGMFDGPFRLYYENGQLALEEFFKEGTSMGPKRLYASDGRLIYEQKAKKPPLLETLPEKES